MTYDYNLLVMIGWPEAFSEGGSSLEVLPPASREQNNWRKHWSHFWMPGLSYSFQKYPRTVVPRSLKVNHVFKMGFDYFTRFIVGTSNIQRSFQETGIFIFSCVKGRLICVVIHLFGATKDFGQVRLTLTNISKFPKCLLELEGWVVYLLDLMSQMTQFHISESPRAHHKQEIQWKTSRPQN